MAIEEKDLVDARNDRDDIFWNFDQDFFNNMQSISPEELGQMVPYISLKTVKKSGEVIEDLNLSYFFRTTDLDNINTGRYTDRPIMSLDSLEIKTTMASGYHYYTHVNLKIKVHNPKDLPKSTAIAMLFPGTPLLLEYGWRGPNSFLTSGNETLLFQVVNYDVTFDRMGQADLTVRGMAYQELFGNTYIGDEGQEIKNIRDENIKEGTKYKLSQLNQMVEYLEGVVGNKKGQRNNKLLKEIGLQKYYHAEDIARGVISKNFQETLDTVEANGGKLKNEKFKKDKTYSLETLLEKMLDKTMKGLHDIIPGVKEHKIIFGKFNDKCGDWSDKSIGTFPIRKIDFDNKTRQWQRKKKHVFTIESMLTLIVKDFLENHAFLFPGLNEKEKDKTNSPSIVTSFLVRPKNGNEEDKVLELYILDANRGVPITTVLLNDSTSSEADTEKEFLNKSIPILRLGHANSFIKNVSFSQLADANMKAILMQRIYKNRPESIRSPIVSSISDDFEGVNPIVLPLRGSMDVIGYPGWKPLKFFYLSSGIYILDAIYKILNVRHFLSRNGFTTTLDLIYH